MKLNRSTFGATSRAPSPSRHYSLSLPWAGASACRSGVALVATLIMLSLVTFMVVAFLGVARRERRSIESSVTQNEAAVARESGFAFAQADILARLLLTGDKSGYGVMVATNFENLSGFAPGVSSPTNVNSALANFTYFANPTPANLANYLLPNLANLQYAPRVPVFSSYYNLTNGFALNNTVAPVFSETNLGRFYLDFNRNGLFDPTDGNRPGDPHWIGLLEYPHLPHGPTNRFTGRWTYLVTPAGKTLDVNLIHNQAKRVGTAFAGTTEGYLRNLGTGPHEMNLAALLAELNPRWTYAYNTGGGVSGTGATNDAFTNALHLLRWRNNDHFSNNAALLTEFGAVPGQYLTNGLFDVHGNGPLMASSNLLASVDALTNWPGGSNINANAQRYFDATELFRNTRAYGPTFTGSLTNLGSNHLGTAAADRDRRTYYTLLASLGVDSWPVTNKLNLNWPNSLGGSAGGETFGFTNWHPDTFFFSAGELMLRASFTPSVFVNTNWTGFGGADANVLVTNYYFGTTFLGTNTDVNSLSLTNIPIFPFSYYSPEVHRLLQFAANLYDATGPPEWLSTQPYAAGDRVQRAGVSYVALNPSTGSLPPSVNWETILNSAATQIYLPTVWRPLFGYFNTNNWPSNDIIRIVGYTTNNTDAPGLLSLPFVDLTDPNSRMAMYNAAPNALGASNFCLVAGTPVIIGARKGYPAFNEFGVQTLFSLMRRLEFVKTAATNAGPMAPAGIARPVQTNQSLIVGLTNIYGFEAWNSYAAAFPRPLRLVATNIARIVVTNEFGPIYTNTTTNGIAQTYAAGAWAGTANGFAAFKSFFFTNVPQLSTNVALGYAYATNYPPLPGFTNGGFIPASPTGPGSPSIFNRSNGFPELRLGITITNSLVFALVDSNRVVDFVTLTNLVAGMDLATALRVTNSPADTGVRFWFTNRLAAPPFGATVGISNQIEIATNYLATSTNQWRNWSLTASVAREIDRFRRWMGLTGVPGLLPNQSLNTNILIVQSPFNPTRVIAFGASWEVNDPLVHYTTRDLSDPFRTSTGDQVTPIVPPIAAPPPPGTLYRVDLGLVNGRLTFTTNGGVNRFHNPWGRMLDPTGTRLASLPNFYTVAPAPYDQRLKDPGVFSSDMWDFPQRKFANLGWIGRVHRGTPWQTFYLKSDLPNPTNWFYWARSVETNPTNDWRLVDVFSAAINAESTRGLLSVNQTNSAAWAAALGGVIVLSNSTVSSTAPVGPFPSTFGIQAMTITPASVQLSNLVGGLTNGLINAKLRIPMWQAVLNYSFGDVVAYHSNLFGNALYPTTVYYRAVAGTNQNQNPLSQVTTNYFAYWTNLPAWSASGIYAQGDLVERSGVSYYAVRGSPLGPPEVNPGDWEPYPQRSFAKTGGVLSTPELSVQSPYINSGRTWQLGTAYLTGARVQWLGWYYQATRTVPVNTPPNPHLNYSDARTLAQTYWWPLESPPIARNAGTRDALNDVFVERIPQQTLGLLHLESSPRLRIYTWGQALRPAERGVYVAGGPHQLMVTNYQITGESAAVAVVRIEGLSEPGFLPRPLPAGSPPVIQPRIVIESFKLTPADN